MRIGIDWSMKSPAITVAGDFVTKFICFKGGKLVPKKNQPRETIFLQKISRDHMYEFIIMDHPEWSDEQMRYHRYADLMHSMIRDDIRKASDVFIEYYAFSAKGRSYQIGESCQTFKSFIWRDTGIVPVSVLPNKLKQDATGNGAAKKSMMADFFMKKCGFYVHEFLDQKTTDDNPSSDIVDSWHLSQYSQ